MFSLLNRWYQADLLRAKKYDGRFIDIGLPETLQWARDHRQELMERPAVFISLDSPAEENSMIEDSSVARRIKSYNDCGSLVFLDLGSNGNMPMEELIRLRIDINQRLAPHGAHIDSFFFSAPMGQAAANVSIGSHHFWKVRKSDCTLIESPRFQQRNLDKGSLNNLIMPID